MTSLNKNVLKLLLAVSALGLAGSASAQSQWWWERFAATAQTNVVVPGVGNVPALLANPTGSNVKLNTSISTQPAVLVIGSAVGGGQTGTGYSTVDLQLSVTNGVGDLPINSDVPDYVFTVTNAGSAQAAATVSFASSVSGGASANVGPFTCLTAPGGSCVVSATTGKASIVVPAGGTVTLSLPAAIGTGLGSVSVLGTVIAASGVVDSNPANNQALATNAIVTGQADVSIKTTDGNQSTLLINVDNLYSLVLSNDGPSFADVYMVPNITTTGSTGYSYSALTMSPTGGASGSLSTWRFLLPPNSSVTVSALIRPNNGAGTITVATTATIMSPNTADPDPSDNTSSDTNTVTVPIPRPTGVASGAQNYVNSLAGAGAYKVIFGGGTFFAMTTDPTFNMVSLDGTNWFKTPRPFARANQMPIYGNGTLVETMADSSLGYQYARSTDNGQTWATGNMPVAGLFMAQTYAEGKFVAIAASNSYTYTSANSNTILYSTNGSNWSYQQMPYAVRWYDVINNGTDFIAVSLTDNRAGYSADGQYWSAITMPGNYATTYGAITSGSGKFVALSRTGGVAATMVPSKKSKTWRSASVLNLTWSAIAYGNGKFAAIAEGSNVLAQSTDGLNWSYSYPLSGSRTWKSLAFGNGVFVGVASDSPTPIVFQ